MSRGSAESRGLLNDTDVKRLCQACPVISYRVMDALHFDFHSLSIFGGDMRDKSSRSAAAKGRTEAKKSAVKKAPAKKSALEKTPANPVKKIAAQKMARQGRLRTRRETDVSNPQATASNIIVGATVMAVKAGITGVASVARNVIGGAKDLLDIRKHAKKNSKRSSKDTVADAGQTNVGNASTTKRDDAG
jgi:hypothetical protein